MNAKVLQAGHHNHAVSQYSSTVLAFQAPAHVPTLSFTAIEAMDTIQPVGIGGYNTHR